MMGYQHRKKRAVTVTCLECNKAFVTGSNNKAHCSAECRIRTIARQFEGVEGCWIWPLSKNPVSGYGQLMHSEPFGPKKLHAAHVLSFSTFVGELGSLQACHRCDVRACFNPAHLFAGTQKDNVQDMIQKGRKVVRMGFAPWNKGTKGSMPSGDQHFLRRVGSECMPRGERHHNSKLNDDAIKEIRASSETLASLAKRFGVSTMTVSSVRRGKIWKHVD